MNNILQGDSLEVLKEFEADSVDLLCTDPPYGYSFMGKSWDKTLPEIGIFKECLRVLKPGAFAFVMSAPRSDVCARMMLLLEDAGFNIGFTPIYWTYASGFPKAMNIGKMVDKRMGIEVKEGTGFKTAGEYGGRELVDPTPQGEARDAMRHTVQSEAGKALDGSYGGFQPKPAVEVIIVAMKPLSEKTFVDQALKNGKGITWLQACAIPAGDSYSVADVCEKIPALFQDSSLPTTDCSKNCKDHDRHVFDADCIVGKELSQWLVSVQSRLPASNEVQYENGDSSVQGSQSDCPICRRFYDEQSHPSKESGQDVLTSQHGALVRIARFLKLHSDTHGYQCTALLSNYDALLSLVRSYCNDTRYAEKKQGRFMANLLVSDDVLNDGVERKSGVKTKKYAGSNGYLGGLDKHDGNSIGDSGSYSRYFDLDAWYNSHNEGFENNDTHPSGTSGCGLPSEVAKTLPFLIVPKASKREKNEGLEHLPEKEMAHSTNMKCANCDLPVLSGTGETCQCEEKSEVHQKARNFHPTVKPLKLMQYLITLGSRPGDTVLDPFAGSGTTGIAAKQLNRNYLLIEREKEYVDIAEARLKTIQDTLFAAVDSQPITQPI